MTVPAIFEVLTNGIMKAQAATLSPAEKRAVSAFLGIAPTGPEVSGLPNACAANQSPIPQPAASPSWTSWGVDLANQRFQNTENAGITQAQIPRLKLKWAFGLAPDAEPRSQPAVWAGTVFIGAGKLYALDAQTGCARWAFASDAPVRSGLTVGPGPAQQTTVFFGNQKGMVYAVSAASGKLLWKSHVDTNFAAMVTAAPVLYKGVLYAGVSSFEEVMAASPQYKCCSFRGSVVALNAKTGAQIWKTYTVGLPEQVPAGHVPASHGPSGAAVWGSPTIDPALQRLYVATGDNYSEPATSTSDSVIAMDLQTGKIAWSQQATKNDIYNVGCDPGVHGACPETHGHDFDFGQPPILTSLPGGKRALLIGQKSGLAYAFDPDANGKPLWSRRIGEGGTLGGIQWGSAAHEGRMYVPLSDLRLLGVPDKTEIRGYRIEADGSKGGGLFALDAATGEIVWHAKPLPCGERKLCSPAQSAPVSMIPGVVFSGSLDGHLRAYAAASGEVIWDADTRQDFTTVNGVPAHGGSLDVAGPVIAGGLVYVLSGYGRYGGTPGNVLLAYGP